MKNRPPRRDRVDERLAQVSKLGEDITETLEVIWPPTLEQGLFLDGTSAF
jgi:hypothetical protein